MMLRYFLLFNISGLLVRFSWRESFLESLFRALTQFWRPVSKTHGSPKFYKRFLKRGLGKNSSPKEFSPNKSLMIEIEDRQLGAVTQVELFEDLAEIVSDGAFAEKHFPCDLLIA